MHLHSTKRNSLSSFCLNCFSKSTLDLKSSSTTSSCPSSSPQKKSVQRSSSWKRRSFRSRTAVAAAHQTAALADDSCRRRPYLSSQQQDQDLGGGWQRLSVEDRVAPASAVGGPEQQEPVTIEGYYRHTLYNSAPTIQKGQCLLLK